jgi:hypothetical protein
VLVTKTNYTVRENSQDRYPLSTEPDSVHGLDERCTFEASYGDLDDRTRPKMAYKRLVPILMALSFFIATIFSLYSLLKMHFPEPPSWKGCGTTREEAISNDCQYEPLQHAWIPDACASPSVAKDYHVFEDRAWFADINMTTPADMDKLLAGDDYTAYTSYYYHEHCLYGWRKLAEAVGKRKPFIDSRSQELVHSNRCIEDMARDWVDFRRKEYDNSAMVSVQVPLIFLECVWLPWYQL